jgi:hypothetical protein
MFYACMQKPVKELVIQAVSTKVFKLTVKLHAIFAINSKNSM